jgi:hypothetical protein
LTSKRKNLAHIRTLFRARGREIPPRQEEDEQKLLVDPKGALVDIQALVRVALGSSDPDVMRSDLELILTITEEALQPRTETHRRLKATVVR